MDDVSKIRTSLMGAVGAMQAFRKKFPNMEELLTPDIQACLDACRLLKKQEAQPVRHITDEYTGITEPHCPCCDCFIDQYNPRRPWQDVKFCCYCGQEVTWDVD